MTASFAELKKNRSQSFAAIKEQANKTANDRGFPRDPRFWTPTFDKGGRAQALIRFLPAPPNEASAFVRTYTHFIRGPGGVYSENCRSTMGEKDPAQEVSRRLWDAKGDEAIQSKAREFGRRKQFISNIYVKRDPANEEAEGRVFLYSFPTTIFDLVGKAMGITDEDDKLAEVTEGEEFDPFSFWDGKDFKLDLYKKGKFNAYDRCGFVAKTTDLLDGDDAKLDALWRSQHSLTQFTQEDNFKSYDELLKSLLSVCAASSIDQIVERILSGETAGTTTPERADDSIKRERESAVSAASETRRPAAVEEKKDEPGVATPGDDDESYLDALMNRKKK